LAVLNGAAFLDYTLTAVVSDADGLSGHIIYQWQSSTDGKTWTDIVDATDHSLLLGSALKGQQVRVCVVYTDAYSNSETVVSEPTAAITAVPPTQSLFELTDTPVNPNFSDNGEDWELGMRFTTTRGGHITAIRYYKSPSETGTHVGKIWSSTGQLIAEVTFIDETTSGWQEQALAIPLMVEANTSYVVSVNANDFYTSTPQGFANSIIKGALSVKVGAGVYNETVGAFPQYIYQNENYFRDIVFMTHITD
jgi:hypothetical protein